MGKPSNNRQQTRRGFVVGSALAAGAAASLRPNAAYGVGLDGARRKAAPLLNGHQRRTPSGRLRTRGLGILMPGTPGRWNAITDVPGVEVGYHTLIEGADVRTGVTAILPRGHARAGEFVRGGLHTLSGNGEVTGAIWLEDSGTFFLPITLTNTFSVGMAHHSVISWINSVNPSALAEFGSPVVGETYDGFLNDINGQHVRPEHVLSALQNASTGPLDQGSIGGGTGMIAFSYKSGSGTASRVVDVDGRRYKVGAFVQANYGRRPELTLRGIQVGRNLPNDDPFNPPDPSKPPPGSGSCIGVIATDAPLTQAQCKALARRASLAIPRTGNDGSVTSGDIFIAFSVGDPGTEEGPITRTRSVPMPLVNPLYTAAAESMEEAILDSLITNEPMTGLGGFAVPAVPHAELLDLLEPHGLVGNMS